MTDKIQSHNTDQPFLPEIRRGRFAQLTIFEVSDSELDFLEKGSPDSIYLNFAVFLLSVAISFTISLLTTTIAPITTFIIFVICTIIGYIGGVVLLVVWLKTRSSVSDCIKTIRKRLPPEGEVQPFETPD